MKLWGVQLPDGCTVEKDGGNHPLARHRANLDAPDGMVWKARDVHCAVVCDAAEVRDLVKGGLAQCEDENCETCQPA